MVRTAEAKVTGAILACDDALAMRVRVKEHPPTKQQICDLVKDGAPQNDQRRVVKRLQKSCYLGDDNQALGPEERLLKQYRKDGLVLFLGAGVSCGSGIPSWTELIKRLLPKARIEIDYEVVKLAFPSLVSQFDLAAHHLDSPLQYTRELYDCLYRDLKKEFRDLLSATPKKSDDEATWQRWNEVVAELQRNGTLKAVGELLIIEEGQKLRRNPQILAVLTTNADNLLEIYCRARTGGKARILTTVDRASVGDHPNAISVYHLHGTLDARGENIVRTDSPCSGIPDGEVQQVGNELLPDLVFRESEYYQTIASPQSFVNHAPLSYLQRLNVLFVGTSLDDLNIRRWLHNSFRERVEHRKRYLCEYYCREYKDAEHEAELESVRHFWIRTRTEGQRKMPADLVELNARRTLGIQVIWCDDYAEVQTCLDDLKHNGAVPNFGRSSG